MHTTISLICITVIPILPFFFWFKARDYGPLRFLLSLAAGLLAVLIAGLAQSFFPPPDIHGGMGFVFFSVFIRISLVEELSRLLTLCILFRFPYSQIKLTASSNPDNFPGFFGAPSGLVAGLGFAAGENIFYGLTDTGTAFLRIFTALPLHAACSARIGTALGISRKEPLQAIVLIITAVFIHGIYNFFILNPGIPWFLPGLIAMSALGSSIIAIRQGEKIILSA